jgi:hypothetical protein
MFDSSLSKFNVGVIKLHFYIIKGVISEFKLIAVKNVILLYLTVFFFGTANIHTMW